MNKVTLFIMSFLIAFTVFFSVKVNSSELVEIKCNYKFKDNTVSVFTMLGTTVNERQVNGDMTMTTYIKNTSKLSEVDDYVLFEKEDKKILFSLKCVKQ